MPLVSALESSPAPSSGARVGGPECSDSTCTRGRQVGIVSPEAAEKVTREYPTKKILLTCSMSPGLISRHRDQCALQMAKGMRW